MQDKFTEQFQKSLREHLVAFNDGVIAIIITIMVLSIPAPKSDAELKKFLFDAMNYSVSFLVVADFWYDAHRTFSTFTKATKKVVIADFFFLLTLSFIPIMTKWIIQDPSPLALSVYGGIYLVVQMCVFGVFIAGNYEQIRKRAIWHTALVRTLAFGILLAAILILVPKITLIIYLVLPIASFLTPDGIRKKHRHYRK